MSPRPRTTPRRATLAATLLATLAPTVWAQSPARLPARGGQAPGKAAAPRQDAAVAKAQAAPVPPKPKLDPEAVRKMDELLARWEAQSKKVRELSAEYTRVDISVAFAITKKFEGQAKLKGPDYVYLDFFELADGKRKNQYADERIVCDGKDVYQFVGQTKRVWVFPLAKNAKQKALSQGPLPFLFNMSAAEAKKRYNMTYDGDSAKLYSILIIPKLAIDREEFTQAHVLLDKETFLPKAIRLWEVNGQDTKTFTFKPESMVVNSAKGIDPGWFNGAKMTSDLTRDKRLGWIVTVNPDPNQDPRAPQGHPTPRDPGPVGAKPAAKGAGIRQR